MRSCPSRLFLATVSLALGILLPTAWAADSTESPGKMNLSTRAEFDGLLRDLDLYLQAEIVTEPSRKPTAAAVTPAERVRRAARRFASGRLAQIEAESPLSPEERAQWRDLVRQHSTRAAAAARRRPLPAPEDLPAEPPTPETTGLQPNATGVLSGRVTNAATGAGISGVRVYLENSYDYYGYKTTDASGNYSFTGVATGSYYASTFNFLGYVDEVWNNIPCDYSCYPPDSGTPISVTDGGTTSNIDFVLDTGGRISGRVVNAVTSAPIASLGLAIYNATNRWVTYAYTDINGDFTSYQGLVPGTYFVMTRTSWNSNPFVDELYDNKPCPFSSCSANTGTPISVTGPGPFGPANFALDPGGWVAGTVTDADTSAGLSGVQVYVYAADGSQVSSGSTNASGSYSTRQNLPTGDYVAVTRNSSGYVDEMWDDIPCPTSYPGSCDGVSAGTPVHVTIGTGSANTDFALDKGGRIAGQVTDAATATGLSYFEVDIYTENGQYLTSGYTDATGNYITGKGFPKGRYRAQSSPWSIWLYLGEVYDDKPCANRYGCSLEQGTTIDVIPPTTTGGIDFALDKGGQITGKVTDASTSAGLAGLEVDIYSEGGNVGSYGYTDSTGSYSASGLLTGRYYAKTYQFGAATYVDEAYNNVPCAGCRPEISGTPIDVTFGATTPGIDFALDKGGSISGRITSAADGAGISGYAYVYTPAGRYVRLVSTNASGNYTLAGLPPGSYLVSTYNSAGFVDEVYNDRPCVGSRCDLTVGTPVGVTAGGTSTVNFALSPGARISGKVTDAATGNGIAGVRINVHKPPYYSVASLTTDSLGNFAAAAGSGRGLPTGGYYVQTSNSLGYLDELYDNIPWTGDVTAGTKVQLTAGAVTTGINFALAKSGGATGTGRIAGKVTRASTGDPLPLFTVRIYNSTGGLVSSVTTDFLGNYLSGSLPLGTYYVAAIVNAADYVNELYDNVPFCSGCSATTGTPVTISIDGSTVSGKDIALDAGGRIEGRVTDASTGAPLLDAFVAVFNASGSYVKDVSVDGLGYYAVHGLTSGTYYALAAAGGAYVNELYNNIACPSCNPNTGTAIAVTAGGPPVTGRDFTLARGGRIEGTITRASDGQPVSAGVTIYDAGGAWAADSVSDGWGFYRSSFGLPTGTYYAVAQDGGGISDAEVYNNKACNSCNPTTTGDAITVTAPGTTTGINFSFDDRSLDFYALTPCRVVDTRNAPSALGGPVLAAREDRTLSVFAACGIPLTAKALSVNLTATGSTAPGNLRLHPGGGPVPGASSLNYSAGQTRANNAVVPLSRFGELAVYAGQASGTVHFILDVNGYFQ